MYVEVAYYVYNLQYISRLISSRALFSNNNNNNFINHKQNYCAEATLYDK